MCETTETTATVATTMTKTTEVPRARFQLYHIPTGENTAVVEFDEALLGNPKFIDPDRMTFPKIPNGNQFTVIPLEDPTVAILSRVMDVHKRITTSPCHLPSMMFGRMDELVQIVGLMFGEVEAFLIEDISDIAKLTDTKRGPDYEPPRVVTRTVLGALLDEVKAKVAENEPKTEDDPDKVTLSTSMPDSPEDEDDPDNCDA